MNEDQPSQTAMTVNNCPVVLQDMNLFEYFIPFCNVKDGFACGSLSKRHNEVVQKVSEQAKVNVIFKESNTTSNPVTIRVRPRSSIKKVSCTISINPRANIGDIPAAYLAYIFNHLSFVAVNFEGARSALLEHPIVRQMFCHAEAVQIFGTKQRHWISDPDEQIERIAASLSMLPKCQAKTWYFQELDFLLSLSEENLEGIEYIPAETRFVMTSLEPIIENASKFRYLDGVKLCNSTFTFQLLQSNGQFPDVLSHADLRKLNAAFSSKFWTKVPEFQLQNILACVIWNGKLCVPPVRKLAIEECWDDVWGSWQELYTRNRMNFDQWSIDFSPCAQFTKLLLINPAGIGSDDKLFRNNRYRYEWEEREEDNMGVLRDVYLAFWERCFNSIGQNIVAVKKNALEKLVLFQTDTSRGFVDALIERGNLRKWLQVERKLRIEERAFGFGEDNKVLKLLKQLLE